MSEKEGVLGRVIEGPRTKKDVRAGKNIRVDEHDMEEYSDYFTDRSASECVSQELSRKENHHNSQSIAHRRRTQVTVPSLSPLSTSNKTSLSSGSIGMTLRSKRLSSNVGIVIPNNTRVSLVTSSALHKRSSMQLGDSQRLIKDASLPMQEDGEQLKTNDCEVQQSSSNSSRLAAKNSLVSEELEEAAVSNSLERPKNIGDSSGGNGACEIAVNNAGAADDDGANNDNDGRVEASGGQADDRAEFLLNQDNQLTLGQSSNAVLSGSLTSLDVSVNVKKRKRKKRCDLFMDKKKRKSSVKSNKNGLEQTSKLNLSPIFPAQKNSKFFTSTPAVKKSKRRIDSVTSISEIASPLPITEVGPTSIQCGSCDPLVVSENPAPGKKQPRKSVTFNHPDAKILTEKTAEATPTILPSFDGAECLHYYETTFQNKSMKRKRIIQPEHEEEGLRRSKRTRVETLRWYKNERIKYKWTPDGNIIDGITTPQKTPRPIHRFVKRMARKAEKDEKKKRGELSVHVPVDENLLRQKSNVVEVLEPYTKNVVAMPCFFKYDQCRKLYCQTKNDATDEDPVVMIPAMELPKYYVRAGYLEIRPLQEKQIQSHKLDIICFFIKHGKVEVTIHQSSFIVETNAMFCVVPGNNYGIKNLRNEEAHLIYFLSQVLSNS